MSRIVTFAKLPLRKKLLAFEAVWGLLQAKILLALVPVRKLLGEPLAGAEVPAPDPAPAVLAEISWAVNAVSKVLRFSNICLVQALAARRMARRRGVATTLFLGVGRDDAGKLVFHAWLKYGDRVVTGGRAERSYRTLEAFRDDSTVLSNHI
jgi:hypothetical protein